jgi:lipoyl(octanoyl) transferase
MKLVVRKLGRVDYDKALVMQEDLLNKRQEGMIPDTLLILEHPPVITLGRRGKYDNILLPLEMLAANGVKTYEVSRGGDVTYHGPGQVIGYPIVDISEQGRDIKQFVWNIEEVFIRLLYKEFGIAAHREEKKFTGVWVGNEKITAIGIAVKRWVTMHGFAFNVDTDLEHFSWINPCGITDRGVTSVKKLLNMEIDQNKAEDSVIKYFCEVFGYDDVE